MIVQRCTAVGDWSTHARNIPDAHSGCYHTRVSAMQGASLLICSRMHAIAGASVAFSHQQSVDQLKAGMSLASN